MDSQKKKNLEESYDRILNVGFCLVPYQDVSDLIHPDVMLVGTTIDEKVFSLSEVTQFIKSQYQHMEGFEPSLERKRLYTHISEDDNSVIIVEEITLTISSPEEVNNIFIRCSCVMEYIDSQWKLTHWHSSTPVETENDHWHMEEWKREREKLQKLVDKQTADLKSKNRELEVETALEKIRSGSLAMHKTDDLRDVVAVLFEQMQELSVDMGFASVSIFIFEEGSRDFVQWLPTSDGLASLNVPYIDHKISSDLFDAWEDGVGYFEKIYTLEEKNEWLEKGFEHTDYKHLPEDFKTSLLEAPGYAMSISLAKHSGICIPSFEGKLPSDENIDILKRVGKVFEQAYTRFLDLQKAEAQAREARIEAALEKVRSHSLAMHNSDELTEVVSVLFEKMKDLQIPFTAVGIATGIEGSKDLNGFVCGQNDEGLVITNYRLPYFDNILAKDFCNALEKQIDFFVGHYSKQEKDAFYEYLIENTAEFRHLPEDIKRMIFDSTSYTVTIIAVNNATFNINDFEGKVLADNEIEIIKRFARVFDQAYTRFLDLQKAEAQTREAQIGLAVERVRAKALAMFKSQEILDVVYKLKEEIMGLNIPSVSAATIHLKEPDGRYRAWDLTSVAEDENKLEISLDISYNIEDTHPDFFMREVWARTEDYFVVIQDGDRFPHTVQWLQQNGYSQEAKEFEEFLESSQLERAYHPTVPLNNGRMCIDLLEAPEPEMESILKKMAGAFDLAYKRFEDLQKAEAQAREAEIQLALERVRARTMAMQNSDELMEVSMELFTQFKSMGELSDQFSIGIFDEDKQAVKIYATLDGEKFDEPLEVNRDSHEVSSELWKSWKSNKKSMTIDLSGESLASYNSMRNSIIYPNGGKPYSGDRWVIHVAFFSQGVLSFSSAKHLPQETGDLLERFAKVFQQTYTRFLDLQKAEAQAREAKIETALEKVRSRTMGMQSSDELPEVANLLFLEVQALGIPAWSCGYCILLEDGKSSTCIMSSEGTLQKPFMLPHYGEVSFEEWDDFVHGDQTFFTQELKGKAIDSHYNFMKSLPQLKPVFQDLVDAGLSLPTYQINHLCKFSHGFLLFITYEPVPDAHDIFLRFTKVFDQTYTRFLDLQKAEAQAKEGQIELSLERIRSQVTAMQESLDLFDIVVKMRSEFISLDHEADYFWHMRWLPDVYEMSMTSEAGDRLGMVINIPKFVHDQIPDLAEWEKGNNPIFVLALDADQAWDYIDNMNTHGRYEQVDPHAPTREDIEHIGGLTFIIARTTHGEIGYSLPGVVPEPPKDALDTLVRFAGVFDLAYKRFEDLKAAERQALLIREERDRLEIALNELHATQDQLVQQEKLASLGQLTAGIAHEIKNPLNFVNNFSEVSIEMIEELRESILKVKTHGHASQLEEITESEDILNDIGANLKKIHEHGSRADSIVKSMLQHSRGGDGKMEPTPLNPIVKEYVNLAFHGMRAGKEPINVDIDLQLDESVGEVPLVAEDFSRVILNLCNNAFDACAERLVLSEVEVSRSAMRDKLTGDRGPETGYVPKLTVRTKSQNGTITIEIEDNGPGIPDDIKDKILQPFFTTKKGTQGTGLGLSITNDIVKAHGGIMSVTSEPGKTIILIELKG